MESIFPGPELVYECGYKYQVKKDFEIQTPFFGFEVNHFFFILFKDGRLLIKRGYAWDGASGPAIDTEDNMISSLVHDCLSQIRQELLKDLDQKKIDKFFTVINWWAKMFWFRRKYYYWGVRLNDYLEIVGPKKEHTIKLPDLDHKQTRKLYHKMAKIKIQIQKEHS